MYEEKNETTLLSSLIEMEKTALDSWTNQLGETYGSYNGYPHQKNVENNLNNSVPDILKKQFSPTEIFLLLASVLLHDIGKIFPDKNDKTDPESKNQHSFYSAVYIQQHWPFLKIPSIQYSRWLAILSCSHCWDNPIPSPCKYKDKCTLVCKSESYSELDVIYESTDGIIRLKWLAALLRMADEVDNIQTRAVDEELSESVKNLSWRRLINLIVFDKEGECIKLRMLTLENLVDQTSYQYIQEAISKINITLKLWQAPLEEMNLKYQEAFIEVSIPVPVLISCNKITLKNFEENSKQEINCSIEPAYKDFIPLKLSKAMIKLENSIIDKYLKSWESLAEEIGVSNPLFVKKMTARLNNITHCKNSRYLNEYAGNIQSMIISDGGWRLDQYDNEIITSINKKIKPEIIRTRIDKLDEFLYPDSKDVKKGFTIYTMQDGRKLTPIIAIVGSSGEGKTTLCLQIASNLVKASTGWCCVYYSLEEEPSRIIQQLKGHEFLTNQYKDRIINLENNKFSLINKLSNNLIFPKLSPKPVDVKSLTHDKLFEERYDELRMSILSLKKTREKIKQFYFIDSLTAFSHQPLARNEINRIFSLFRDEEVPLIITLERQAHWALTNEETHYNYAKYLSDVVIRIESDYKDDYFKQTIEVAKSRYTRRILGKHLMKLKSKDDKATGAFDKRHGVVIYPSIHYHLFQSRSGSPKGEFLETRLPHDLPIYSRNKTKEIESDSCIVISGPHGSHKLALGINILLGINSSESKKKQKLIISFSEEKEINIGNVALFKELENWRVKLNEIKSNEIPAGTKVWEINFGTDNESYVTILNFRLGQILPEEFFFIINKYLSDKVDRIEGVLITTTAQIKTRFPFLNKEPLFFPVLVDIIKSKGMYSIFIDALDATNAPLEALQAAADVAIFIEGNKSNKNENILTVENIRGKNYDRAPRKYSVNEKTLILNQIKGSRS